METEESQQMLVVTGELKSNSKAVERGLTDVLRSPYTAAIDVSVLQKNLQQFFRQLREILESGADEVGAFSLSQVEIAAQISAEGKVSLLGSGGSVGAQGALKFVLKRTES